MTTTSTPDPKHKRKKQPKLILISDTRPGFRRRRAGKGFVYYDTQGKAISNRETIQRIKDLGIPPAWENVWIAPSPQGYIQATGRDAKGRKQYRYHSLWNEQRGGAKFERMLEFAAAMPAIREQVQKDLTRPGMPREKVLALLVSLLEQTFIRVGNPEYARANKSYGLTTLQDKHVSIAGTTVAFSFRGKSGIEHEIKLQDKRLVRLIERSRDIPGKNLFQYLDADGKHHPVISKDVNQYLRDVAGETFSAKDFRTWGGTLLAAQTLLETEPATTQTQAKKAINQAIRAVCGKLGNTLSICRKYYIHPLILEAYLDGRLHTLAQKLKVETADREAIGSVVVALIKGDE